MLRMLHVPQTRSCPCGTNSQECYDPIFGETYCYPLADFWLLGPIRLGVSWPMKVIVNWDFQQLVIIISMRSKNLVPRLKEALSCPLYCSDSEDYCYIPSYDAKGNWIKTTVGAAVWNCETQGVWGLQKCFMCKLDQHSGSVQPVSIGLSSKSITPGWSLSGVIDWDDLLDLLGVFGYCRAQMDYPLVI